MGNYYTYNTIQHKLDIPLSTEYDDIESLRDLFKFGSTTSKRWDMVNDVCRMSRLYSAMVFQILITNETSPLPVKAIFKNGKVLLLQSELIYPNFDMDYLQDPDTTKWNINASCAITNQESIEDTISNLYNQIRSGIFCITKEEQYDLYFLLLDIDIYSLKNINELMFLSKIFNWNLHD